MKVIRITASIQTKRDVNTKTNNAIPCCICGEIKKNIKHKGNIYCQRHYSHIFKYGKVLYRTAYDYNEFSVRGNITEIYLYDINCQKKGTAFIDTKNLNIVKNYKWSLSLEGYVVNKKSRLSRLIMNAADDFYVDYIDGNPLNCTENNLRLLNKSQNAWTCKIGTRNTSGFKGVSWNKTKEKWKAYITVNKKTINIGYYDRFDDAKDARIRAEVKYYGEYSPYWAS